MTFWEVVYPVLIFAGICEVVEVCVVIRKQKKKPKAYE